MKLIKIHMYFLTALTKPTLLTFLNSVRGGISCSSFQFRTILISNCDPIITDGLFVYAAIKKMNL